MYDDGDWTVQDWQEFYLDLRLLPLVDVSLCDLKIDPLDAAGTAHDLNAAQVRLKVVKHTLCLLQEPLQSDNIHTSLHQSGYFNLTSLFINTSNMSSADFNTFGDVHNTVVVVICKL